MSGTAARVAVLERIATVVRTERRHRSPVEAPAAFTMAYVDLILALGRARLGVLVDAGAAVERARERLGRAAADPVHGWLLDAFGWRIARTLEGAPPELPLAPELLARRATLDRVARYKVDRVRQELTSLDPEPLDAIGLFSRGQSEPIRPTPDPLVEARRQLGLELASGAPRAATLEAFLAEHDLDLGPLHDRVVIAGVAAALDRPRGRAVLAEAHAALAKQPRSQNERELLIRRVGLAYGLASSDAVAHGIEQLLALWPTVADSGGTNSHFCLAVLAYVDVLVGAVTDPVRPD